MTLKKKYKDMTTHLQALMYEIGKEDEEVYKLNEAEGNAFCKPTIMVEQNGQNELENLNYTIFVCGKSPRLGYNLRRILENVSYEKPFDVRLTHGFYNNQFEWEFTGQKLNGEGKITSKSDIEDLLTKHGCDMQDETRCDINCVRIYIRIRKHQLANKQLKKTGEKIEKRQKIIRP